MPLPSRAPTWGIARELQAKMFREAAPIGHLDVQLVYLRGSANVAPRNGRDEWRAPRATDDSVLNAEAGYTQIGRVLKHGLAPGRKAAVQALVFIGDAMEESLEELAGLASALGTVGLPIFMFQEGRDPAVRKAFRLLALKSGGAYFEFNPDKPRAVEQLSEQLNAVARLAVGDVAALERTNKTAAITGSKGTRS